MRIFLGNAPWYHGKFYGVRAGSRWPHFEDPATSTYMPFPFFLAYAAAVLEREPAVDDLLMVDGVAEQISEEAFVDRAHAFAPDLLVLEVSTASIPTDLRVAQAIAERCPGIRIAMCGLHVFMQEASFFVEHPFVDFVFVGEYEYIAQDLVRALKREKQGKPPEFAGIQGLIWRKTRGENEVERNMSRPVVQDLDSIPWPSRHQLPMLNYRDEPGSIPTPSGQMWASRGCPYKCVFCAWPQIMYGDSHTQYRVRDPKDVVDEMQFLVEHYGMRSIYIDDDTFNIGKKRMLRFAELVKERNLGVPWAVMARADTSDEVTMEAFADAGMKAIKFGVESGDQDIVKKSGKNLNLERLRRMVKKCHELGIRIHLTFTFGLPGETKETVQKTIDLALELDPHSLQYSIVTPFPGSRLYEMMDDQGKLESKDWSLYDGYNNAVMRTETLSSRDLEGARRRASDIWERYREQRAWEESGQKIFSGSTLLKAIKQPHRAVGKLVRLLTPIE